MAKKSMGKNIEYRLEGSKLIIEIDTSKDQGPSGSGKTIIIATSEGNQSIGEMKLGLNLYKYPTAKPAKTKK